MTEPVDVTQTAEYLELMQVSEEMEADLMRQLAEKDQVIAQQLKLSQAKIAQLEADLAGRDKELESYIEELEAANEAKMKAKDAEAAALKQALSLAEAKLQQPQLAAAVCTQLLRAEAARDVLVCD
jgi:chromosome segregation ATPase